MSKRVLSNALFTPTLPFYSFNLKFLSRLLSTDNSLQGLVDPDLNFTGDDSFSPRNSQAQSVSDQDFTFIRESLSGSKEENFGSGKSSNDAFTIVNAIRTNNDGLGEKSQKFLRQFREKLNENLVVDVLKYVQSAELGIKFFMWAGRQIGYTHSLAVYNALLDILGIDKNDRIPNHFFQEIKDCDREVLGRLLNVLIRKCCQNGRWNLALEELGRLKDFGYKPSRVTYNALILVFLEAGRLDTAFLLHREMMHLGSKMDMHLLGCFVHSLCKVGKWRDALELIDKEDVIPNALIYTRMISGLCEASLFEEAMNFLDRMRSSSCFPNIVTYEVLLCGCLNKRKLGRCKRILSMMITEGCYPSPKIFNSLIHSYCKSGDYSYAYKLLKKMADCGYQRGYVPYNILIGSICGNEELPTQDVLELAEKAYSEMLNAGVVLNKINVSSFARCLCGVGKYEKAYNVIHEMMSKGFIPDTSTYNNVISFLCGSTKVDKAFLLFQEMRRNDIVPNVYTYTILIDSFCKAGLIQQARCWLSEMLRDECAPTVVTYTSLIHAYLKARKISDANQLFELMLSKGCVPNIVTFTALIDGYCKAGDIERACQIYARMRGNGNNAQDVDAYFKITDDSSKEPNIVTYGALVDGLCKAHRVDEARKLLDAMWEAGCEPNHVVYDALIDGFCKASKLEEAQQVFTKMSERGYSPNVYTYSSLIDKLFKDKRLDLALKVLSKMLESSCAPNVIIYTEMIDGLCKVGKTGEAYKLMLMMEEKGCKPNVVTYTCMIDGFGKAGEVDKSLRLLQDMSSKGCAPNYITYRVLINHCCDGGRLDEAYQLLEEMKQTYWPKHLANYQKVVEGFSKEFIASLEIVDEISKDESAPLSPVYELLINSFQKAGKLETALELHKEFSDVTFISPSHENMYYSLIESLAFSHKVDQAVDLYSEMIEKGGTPQLSVIVNLVKGLVKVSRWEDALLLSERLCYMDVRWLLNEQIQEGK